MYFVFLIGFLTSFILIFSYISYIDFKKYNHLKSIKKDDKFVIVEALGAFGEIIYTKVTCIENDKKNKIIALSGVAPSGSLFAKTYRYSAWNFKDFHLMQKVFDTIEEGLSAQKEDSEKVEISLADSLAQTETLLAKSDFFEDAAKVRDIKNKILDNA